MYIFFPKNLLDRQRQRYKWPQLTPCDHFKISFFLWENIIFRLQMAYLVLHLMNKTFLVDFEVQNLACLEIIKKYFYQFCHSAFSFFDLRSKSSTSINLICIENTEIDCPRRVKTDFIFHMAAVSEKRPLLTPKLRARVPTENRFLNFKHQPSLLLNQIRKLR